MTTPARPGDADLIAVPVDTQPTDPSRATVTVTTYTEYADAQHGFDTPLGPPVVVAKGAQTVRACTIKEGPAGVLVNTATGAPFAYTDACVQLDPHVGRNAAATAAAQAAVGDFVRTLFKLK